MWLKLAAAALVLVASTLAGRAAASVYEERTRELQAFATSLSLLQSEIAYARRTLPEALRQVAERAAPEVRPFFWTLLAHMEDPAGSLAEMWLASLRESRLSLSREDLDVLADLGQALGRSHAAEEVRHVERCRIALEARLDEARHELAKKGRLWRTAGFLSGLMLVLLLL